MSAIIQVCTTCSAAYFPHRLICFKCGGADFVDDKAEVGIIETTTKLPDGTQIATVTSQKDLHFIARIIGGTVKNGDRIQLSNDSSPDSGLVAYVPFHGTNLQENHERNKAPVQA